MKTTKEQLNEFSDRIETELNGNGDVVLDRHEDESLVVLMRNSANETFDFYPEMKFSTFIQEVQMKIDIADIVEHLPSGETWIVARVDDVHIWPCGWPGSMAMLKDCILIKKATEHEKNRLIDDLKILPVSDARSFVRHEQNNGKR